MKTNERKNILKNNSGLITAEFLFSFVLIIGCGILMFALTFSLMTVEVAQYITWSAARSYMAGNVSEKASIDAGQTKYQKLIEAFPLLTGKNSGSQWFEMSDKATVGATVESEITPSSARDNIDAGKQVRQSWDGISATIDLKLFKGIRIPFLGKIADNPDDFELTVRTHLSRNPSVEECQSFFKNKYTLGIKNLKQPKDIGSGGPEWKDLDVNNVQPTSMIEDNGC